MTKTIDDFRYNLGYKESTNNYKKENSKHFIGKYQMGEAALVDAGYYTDPHIDYDICDWEGTFTGKDGVYSKEDFLNNPHAQENALNIHKRQQWQYFINHGYATDKYLGKIIDGIKITPSSMLGGAHLGGHGKVEEILRTDGKSDARDAFKSSVKSYMRDFQDYDVTEWTGPRYRPDGRILTDEELKQFESEQKQHEKIEGKIGKIHEKQEPQKSKFSKTKQKRKLSPEELEKSVDKAILRIFLGTIIYGLNLLGAKNGNIEDSKITLIRVLKMVAKNNNMKLSDLVDYIYNKIIELDTYEQNKYMMKYLNQKQSQQNLKSQTQRHLNMNFAELINKPQMATVKNERFNTPIAALKDPSLNLNYEKNTTKYNTMKNQTEKNATLYKGSEVKSQPLSANGGQSILDSTVNSQIPQVQYNNLPEFEPLNIKLEENPVFNFGSTNYARNNMSATSNGGSFNMNEILKLSMKILGQYLSGDTNNAQYDFGNGGTRQTSTSPQQYYEFIPPSNY